MRWIFDKTNCRVTKLYEQKSNDCYLMGMEIEEFLFEIELKIYSFLFSPANRLLDKCDFGNENRKL